MTKSKLKHDFNEEYLKSHSLRFRKTLEIIKKYSLGSRRILDIGPFNPLSEMMIENGYDVTNTPKDTDLDFAFDLDVIISKEYEIATSFEIFEHMVNPFCLLNNLGAQKLIATVPLKLWFKKAYWNANDPMDRHYHEFESRQFDMLLDKSGWEVIHSEKWLSKSKDIGIRPFLRNFWPRYYVVVAQRKIGFKENIISKYQLKKALY